MSAPSLWNLSAEGFPADGSPRQKLGFALHYATLAPTTIQLPSWEPRLADTHLEMMAHDNPALEAMDRDGRESMIDCGAALQYLKLALKHFNCLGRIAIFPNLTRASCRLFCVLVRLHQPSLFDGKCRRPTRRALRSESDRRRGRFPRQRTSDFTLTQT